MAKKRVYFFGGRNADGNKKMKNLLGGKGANLAEMANLKIPVPAGFTITTAVNYELWPGITWKYSVELIRKKYNVFFFLAVGRAERQEKEIQKKKQ